MMSLNAHGDAAQRPCTCRGDGLVATDKGADGFVMRADRFQRLRDRGIRRKIAGIDTALEFGERHPWHYFIPCGDRTAFTEPVGMGQVDGSDLAVMVRPFSSGELERKLSPS